MLRAAQQAKQTKEHAAHGACATSMSTCAFGSTWIAGRPVCCPRLSQILSPPFRAADAFSGSFSCTARWHSALR